ncbi:RRI1 [[Candida] subhashii]|uniref:COP9 signalosome complex subunit 5 n=1 Tax=[Candida] subhashii TaxID=561895 RepID=A0A8J5R712_9ASCO|nr:RRI1 [[Candida] subhashii]KAG7666010.1 RRI1 [[Candida] subhashii]
MSCSHEIAAALEVDKPDQNQSTVVDLQNLPVLPGQQPGSTNSTTSTNTTLTTGKPKSPPISNKTESFYSLPPISSTLGEKRPWRQDPHYFSKCYISSLALMKMTIHAQLGGSIEVMGMLVGKIIPGSIIVMDVYRLPVEGTETRVNAQAEGYEYMVQYLEMNKKLDTSRMENIVGWYHSHPGYGCWLSGIDVSTQALNQGFQDPYVAIVVDPIKTLRQGKVEIGVFRTYPDGYVPPQEKQTEGNSKNSTSGSNKVSKILPKSKRKDFGSHSERYYALDVEIFGSQLDQKIIEMLSFEDSLSWLKNMLYNTEDNFKVMRDKDVKSMQFTKNYDLISDDQSNDSNNYIFKLVDQLRQHRAPADSYERVIGRKFDNDFEDKIYEKLLMDPKGGRKGKARSHIRKPKRTGGSNEVESEVPDEEQVDSRDSNENYEDEEDDDEDDVMDESDLENESGGSDGDGDTASIESGPGNQRFRVSTPRKHQSQRSNESKSDEEEIDKLETNKESEEEYDELGSQLQNLGGTSEEPEQPQQQQQQQQEEEQQEDISMEGIYMPDRRSKIDQRMRENALLKKRGFGIDRIDSRKSGNPRFGSPRGGGGGGKSYPSSSKNSRFLAEDFQRSTNSIRSMGFSEFGGYRRTAFVGSAATPTTGRDDARKRILEIAELAKSIGQREVYDLITLETQEKLFK